MLFRLVHDIPHAYHILQDEEPDAEQQLEDDDDELYGLPAQTSTQVNVYSPYSILPNSSSRQVAPSSIPSRFARRSGSQVAVA